MKTRIIAVILALAFCFGFFNQNVAAGEPVLDSRSVARALSQFEATATYYGSVWGYYYATNSNGQLEYPSDYHYFEMDKDKKFTRYEINGKDIPVKGIKGIPIRSGGFNQLQMHMYTYDVNGSFKSDGYVYLSGVSKRSSINIVLTPNRLTKTFRPSELGIENVNLGQVELVSDGQQIGYYDKGIKQFIVNYDWRKDTEFEVRDRSTGNTLGYGVISALGVITMKNDSPLNIAYEGGVVEIVWSSPYWKYFNGRFKSDSRVLLDDGTVCEAKVFITDLELASMNIWSTSDNERGTRFIVEEVAQDGSISEVPLLDTDNREVKIIPAGRRKVIITVIAPYSTSVDFQTYDDAKG